MARFLLLIAFVVTALVAFAVAGDYDGVESYPAAQSRSGYGWGSGGGYGGGFGGGYGGGYGGGSGGIGGGGWGWGPRFRILNFRIPVPILPRIRLNLGWETKGKGWGGW